jgi:hypothetical protein
MVDLRIIQIQLVGEAVTRPGPKQRIDQDIQGLAKIVAPLDHIAAVTVDEQRQIGG